MGFWDITAGSLAKPVGEALYGQHVAKQQFDRQKELMNIQMMNQKELNRQGQQFQMDMWEKTNYKEQMKQMRMAGLNPALLYGKGGGGGATTGSQGGGSAASGSASMAPMMDLSTLNIARQKAEIDLINANRENVVTKTENEKQEIATKEFEKAIREKYRNQIEVARQWEWTSTGTKSEEEWKAWQVRKQILYNGDEAFNPEKPNEAGKGVSREIQTSIENLKQLKTKGDILEFEKAIDEFGANLAKNGISPDSPWYAKVITDMLEKVGLGGMIRQILTGGK